MERGEKDSNAYENMKQYMYKYKLAVQINYAYASFLGPVIY